MFYLFSKALQYISFNNVRHPYNAQNAAIYKALLNSDPQKREKVSV